MSGSDLCILRNGTVQPRYFPNRITVYNVLSPNFHIHVSVSDLYIPRIGLPIWLQPNRQTDHGNIYVTHRYMSNINERGHTVSFLGIHKLDFWYSASSLSLTNHPCVEVETRRYKCCCPGLGFLPHGELPGL